MKKINLFQIGYLEFRTNLRFFSVIILVFRTISQQLNSTNLFYKIVLEIRKHGLSFKLSRQDFRKLFLNTFYKYI